jgi:hypothetical protein
VLPNADEAIVQPAQPGDDRLDILARAPHCLPSHGACRLQIPGAPHILAEAPQITPYFLVLAVAITNQELGGVKHG